MHRSLFGLLTSTPLLIGTALCAQAQGAPPIKPGLWQVQGERQVDGKSAPDPGERLKSLPPEVRKQLEASMKSKGVAMGSGGLNRICHTRESLDQGRWRESSERCKTEVLSRSASSWKWHSSCKQPDSEMDGEALFAGPESYTVKTAMTMARKGEMHTSHMTVTAKWLGSDCGDLKPMTSEPSKK